MLRGIIGTSLTSKSLIVLLEYSDDFLLINVDYKQPPTEHTMHS